jgi:zinc protease
VKAVRALVFGSFVLLGACGGGSPPPASLPPPAPPPTLAPAPAAPAPVAIDRSKLPAPGAAPNWSPSKPQVFTLKNGTPVYFTKQGPTPLVSILLVLPRGSATDPKGKAGLTALMADVLDEGAGGKSGPELSAELQRLGTDYSVATDVDNLMFAMNTIAESFAPSVRILADVVQKPAFDPKEFTRRKDQHLAEALAAESEPASARSIVVRKALFANGYAAEIPTGTRPSLKTLTLADAKAQYRRVIAPDGAAFVVVGGIDR